MFGPQKALFVSLSGVRSSSIPRKTYSKKIHPTELHWKSGSEGFTQTASCM